MQFTLETIDFQQQLHCEAVAGLWTGACGPLLALSPGFVGYATRLGGASTVEGRFAWKNDEPIGVILINIDGSNNGQIIALATLPESQRQGIATALLDWAESWLAAQGVQTVALGGGIRPFVHGLPIELESASFFSKRGYLSADTFWDMAFNLAQYLPPASLEEVAGAVYPAKAGQENELLSLFAENEPPPERNPPYVAIERFIADGGRLSDFMLLWTDQGVQGACQLTFEDSLSTVEAGFPYQLPRSWGHLGNIKVSGKLEGSGFAQALIDAGLRRLHNNGVNGCVVSGCSINSSADQSKAFLILHENQISVDLMAEFGFQKHRKYSLLTKQLQAQTAHR